MKKVFLALAILSLASMGFGKDWKYPELSFEKKVVDNSSMEALYPVKMESKNPVSTSTANVQCKIPAVSENCHNESTHFYWHSMCKIWAEFCDYTPDNNCYDLSVYLRCLGTDHQWYQIYLTKTTPCGGPIPMSYNLLDKGGKR